MKLSQWIVLGIFALLIIIGNGALAAVVIIAMAAFALLSISNDDK